jgi:hypothetical protein
LSSPKSVPAGIQTVVVTRKGELIVWNAVFGQVALDYRFAPELCWPRAGQQKGAVENLVGWVKGSFFKCRRFHDRADLLEAQLREWLTAVNKPLALWGRVLHDADLATAFFDRVLERGPALRTARPLLSDSSP